jgi:hypothetical protein
VASWSLEPRVGSRDSVAVEGAMSWDPTASSAGSGSWDPELPAVDPFRSWVGVAPIALRPAPCSRLELSLRCKATKAH